VFKENSITIIESEFGGGINIQNCHNLVRGLVSEDGDHDFALGIIITGNIIFNLGHISHHLGLGLFPGCSTYPLSDSDSGSGENGTLIGANLEELVPSRVSLLVQGINNNVESDKE